LARTTDSRPARDILDAATIEVKNGLVISEMITPSTVVARIRRLRAGPLGR